MNWLRILELLKAIIPTNKIAAWIVGIFAALVAIGFSLPAGQLKDEFCKGPAVTLPSTAPETAAPAEAPKK